jgi:hypothetical protein
LFESSFRIFKNPSPSLTFFFFCFGGPSCKVRREPLSFPTQLAWHPSCPHPASRLAAAQQPAHFRLPRLVPLTRGAQRSSLTSGRDQAGPKSDRTRCRSSALRPHPGHGPALRGHLQHL